MTEDQVMTLIRAHFDEKYQRLLTVTKWKDGITIEQPGFAITQFANACACAQQALDWQPIISAPKDGRWIIGLCNDSVTLYRVSWGRNRRDELGWCSAEKSYGERFFKSWAPWPGTTTPLHQKGSGQ